MEEEFNNTVVPSGGNHDDCSRLYSDEVIDFNDENDEITALQTTLEQYRQALDTLNRFASLDLCLVDIPDICGRYPSEITHNGWHICEKAIIEMANWQRGGGGQQNKNKKTKTFKTILRSNFSPRNECNDRKKHSRSINSRVAYHTQRLFPNLPNLLLQRQQGSSNNDDSDDNDDGDLENKIILLLLESPSYDTIKELTKIFDCPELQRCSNICIPQADPIHYQKMIKNTCSDPAMSTGGGGRGRRVGEKIFVNIRCQRLDEWLCCNSNIGLKPIVFFADYETSIYGIPKCNFSPLLDIRRFFRLGYTKDIDLCLFALTISMRRPSVPDFCHRLDSVGAVITLEAIIDFIIVEANAVGMDCKLIDELGFGLNFMLFELRR